MLDKDTPKFSLRGQFINWRRSFNLIWAASPRYTTAWTLLLIFQGALPGLLIYLTKHTVDNLLVLINSKGSSENLNLTIFYIAATAGVMLLTEVIQSSQEMVRLAQADIIQDHIKSLVHNKSATVDIAHFESPEYHDRLEQATASTNLPLTLLENLGGLLQNLITLFVMAGLLIQYSVWLPFILVISTLPAFIVMLRYDRAYHKWWQSRTGDRRWIQYFDMLITNSFAIAEVRVFNLNPFFQGKYQNLRKRLRGEVLQQTRRLSIAKFFSAFVSLCILGLTISWMGWRALSGIFTLGDLVLFYQAFDRGQGLMRTLFNNLSQMLKNSLFINVLFEFLDLESKVTDPQNPVETPSNLKEGIKISNLTFRYPGTERNIIKDLSLFIPAGKSVAIVGENGSGKTTLTKLLCRFYDPDSGSIEFDGINIKNFSVKNLLKMITMLFQAPIPLYTTVRESIKMGDLETDLIDSEIENVAQTAGAHDFIERLPQKYDTPLGRMHGKGAAELSGGQWQRLGLARAYLRKAPIILLDEPTSFLDSWAEADWFDRFRKLTTGRTSIVITHRFTIAMRADLIIVMDKGEILEKGTHAELLALDGLYAKSWKEQMQTKEENFVSDSQFIELENHCAGEKTVNQI